MALVQILPAVLGLLALGLRLLRRAGFQKGPMDLPLSFLLGLSCLIYVLLGLSALNGLSDGPIKACWFFLLSWGVVDWELTWESWNQWRRPLKDARPFEKFLLAAALILLILSAFKPEVFYDAWVYHLGLPEMFLQAGNAKPMSYHFFSWMPVGKELLMAFSMGLGGEAAAKTMAAVLSLIAPLMLAAWGSQIHKPRAGLAAAVLFISTPLVFTAARRLSNEPFMAAFLIGALYFSLGQGQFSGRWGEPILAGLLNGLLFSSKYFAGPWCLLLAFLYIAMRKGTAPASRKGTGLFYIKLYSLYLLGALLPLLPWLWRSYSAFGDPLYPFLSMALGKIEPSDTWRVMMNEMRHWYPGTRGISDLAVLFHGSFQDYTGAYFMGPSYLVMLALILAFRWGVWNRKPVPASKAFLTFLVLAWIAGLSQSHYLRYLSPLLAPTALLLCLEGEALVAWPGKVYAVFFNFFLVFNLFWMLYGFRHSMDQKAMIGTISASNYLETKMGDHWKGLQWVHNNLPTDVRILAIGETRPYRFERPVMLATVHNEQPALRWIENSAGIKALEGHFRDEGITHVYYHYAEEERNRGYGTFNLSEKGKKLWQEFIQQRLRPIHAEGTSLIIYELLPDLDS